VWTDSWLSIASAGWDMTGVRGDEKQTRKVVVGEASKCAEEVGLVRGTRWPAESRMGCMWQEQRDEVVDVFLVGPQNKGRAGTMWEPSHEW
jgi:hypothetical protein